MRAPGRILALLVAAAVLQLAVAPAPARASRLVTWVIQSSYVNVAEAQFNSPPPGDPKQAPALRVNVLLADGYNGRRRFPVLSSCTGTGTATSRG